MTQLSRRAPLAAARFLGLALMLACSLGGGFASIALADEYTDRLNKLVSDPDHPISDKARSDIILLPLLAAMDKAPAVLRSQDRAALLANQGPGWSECADWAQKPAQKAIIEALDKVTKEEDRLKAFAFAQPYGVDALRADKDGITLIAKEMYTELGEPPLIAGARQLYLPAMENAGILAHVEASRLFAAGDAAGALKVTVDWLFFCRQMADRPLLREKKWAMESMLLALERIRDIIYLDLTAEKHAIDAAALRKMNDRLKERKGFLQVDKIRLPEGDFIGREQLIKSIMRDGKPDETAFAPTMARTSATERPLKLFSAAAYWDQARAGHAGERDSLNMLRGIHDDWARRWELPYFDRYVSTATDYRKFVQTTTKFAALNEAFNDVDTMFALRQRLRVELGGTRMAVGPYGFLLRYKSLPVNLAATRPEFIDVVDRDPYSSGKATGTGTDMHYYVPMRDTPTDAQSGNPKPFTINLYPPAPNPEFKRDLNDKVYVIYSVGPDDASDRAAYATQTRTGVKGDYLLFPPTLSLFRQRLAEKGELK